jgi:hypothetical protein
LLGSIKYIPSGTTLLSLSRERGGCALCFVEVLGLDQNLGSPVGGWGGRTKCLFSI